MFCLYLPVQRSSLFICNDNSIIDVGFFDSYLIAMVGSDITECRP